MNMGLLLVVCVVVVAILLRLILPRTEWYRLARLGYLIRKSADDYDLPELKLKRAQKAVEVLRAGHDGFHPVYRSSVPSCLSPENITSQLRRITEALEADFSYEQIGATREEVIGFRNGEAHKTSARLQIALSRDPQFRPRGEQIAKLAENAGFTLEEVGTSAAELESLDREYSRQIWENLVDQFRQYATGASDSREDPDEFEKRLTQLLSPEYGFSYEDLRTSEVESVELMRLARRREVEIRIGYLHYHAERGDTDNKFTRKSIAEALTKAGLTLADFNFTEADLDKIEQSAHLTKARNLLDELRTPEESWFYLSPPIAILKARIYRPTLLNCVPGDPAAFVREIEKNLAAARATLADIGIDEKEIAVLVQAGHLFSAQFLIEELRRISRTPHRGAGLIVNIPGNQIAEKHAYPVERDIQAIEYHLQKLGIGLKEVGSSERELRKLQATIKAK